MKKLCNIIIALSVLFISCKKENESPNGSSVEKTVQYTYSSQGFGGQITYTKANTAYNVNTSALSWETTFSEKVGNTLKITSQTGVNDFTRVIIYVDGSLVAEGNGYGSATAQITLN